MAHNSNAQLRRDHDAPSAIEDRRSRLSQWPMILALTFLWVALWQDLTLGTIVLGMVFSSAVMLLLPLPPVPFADRFNLYHSIKFAFYFLWKITAATWDVARKAGKPGPKVVNSVVAVKLRTQDDLLLTLVGHVYALIPGSLVIDVDRPSSTLFLHVLDIPDEDAAQAFRVDSLDIEARMIRGFGSKRDYALIKAEDRAGDGVVRRHSELEELDELHDVQEPS
ncbi:MAG TPA: Na+/H+ antiporter subunit E [Enteractinococcus sp.]